MRLKFLVNMLHYYQEQCCARPPTKKKKKKKKKRKVQPYSNKCQERNVRVGSHLVGHETCFHFLKFLVVEKCIMVALTLFVQPWELFSQNNRLPFQFIFKLFHEPGALSSFSAYRTNARKEERTCLDPETTSRATLSPNHHPSPSACQPQFPPTPSSEK